MKPSLGTFVEGRESNITLLLSMQYNPGLIKEKIDLSIAGNTGIALLEQFPSFLVIAFKVELTMKAE